MAKNTLSSAFRHIDVDQFDDTLFQDEELAPGDDRGPDEQAVIAILHDGRYVDALKQVLDQAPLQCRRQQTRDAALTLVLRVLTTFRSSDVAAAVSALSGDQLDLLMKYLYRCFPAASDGSHAILLTWFDRVFQSGGNGCVMRALTDRRVI